MKIYRWACLLLAAAAAFGQGRTIRTTVPLVVASASVTDPRGHFVYGLNASDFLLLDDGKPRPVEVIGPDSVIAPFDLVVLVQTTDLSRSALLKIRKTGAMIQEAVVGANGAAAVVTFADQVRVVQKFTNNAYAISDSFSDLKAADSRKGRMIDAVAKALDMLRTRPKSKRAAILIIGESKDRGSKAKLQDLLPQIEKSEVTIYSLNYSAYLTAFTTKGSEYQPPDAGGGWILGSIVEAVHATKEDTCKVLTGATGGRMLKFETQSKLENDLIHLGSDIHNRYILSFEPTGASPGFHKIVVRVKGRPELQVYTRVGYWR